MKIDEHIDSFFAPVADAATSIVFFSVPIGAGLDIALILIWLVVAAFFFSFYLGFVNFRYFGYALKLVSGKAEPEKSDKGKKEDGEITPFQALASSLSGTVGLGNIAGVAVAVSLGGPGATLWMIIMGLFSMSTKFVEVAAGVKYRHHASAEHPSQISGGPMYYLRDAFANRNIPVLGPVIASLFAISCVGGAIGGGNMFQANQAYQQALNVTGGADSFLVGNGWIFGLCLAVLVGIVIIGGIRSIAAVAGRLVPAMAGLYLLAGLIVIAVNFANIPQAFAEIIHSAFSLEAGIGGLIGGILVGVQRAAFSNEAGLGSAAIVHSAAKTNSHIKQGFVGMLGPFIDTVIICTVTALVIVISGVFQNTDGVEGIQMTSDAFATGLPWFPYVLSLAVLLFAYSTIITWSYYGVRAVTFLLGERDWLVLTFKILFCCFVVIGASSELGNIIAFSDAMLLSMGIPNIIGLYLLAPEIRRDLRTYIDGIKSAVKS